MHNNFLYINTGKLWGEIMPIGKLFGINPANAASSYQINRNTDNNFVKNTFNFENANLNRPAARVYNSPLGDPDKAAVLDLLA